jgi:hypothetical protein
MEHSTQVLKLANEDIVDPEIDLVKSLVLSLILHCLLLLLLLFSGQQ